MAVVLKCNSVISVESKTVPPSPPTYMYVLYIVYRIAKFLRHSIFVDWQPGHFSETVFAEQWLMVDYIVYRNCFTSLIFEVL